ncbi:PREDICTED: V-set and transmembrane domain-containing protein 2-like protein [Charadrius vociferus]|uniref:V-set and transmembrane domain-containing protein 2-like protein n=1 Tax=Charadrius vociferus TaxID=50402 RepID=UPI000521901A|nr:PREDICTED: V-set and transmembrane domain-containing protein 2-like protein [Charadrius vociferus]
MTAQAGEDVEMACSFRGSGSPSYSLEIQWWYVRNHKDWTDKQTWASNQLKASPQEEPGKDATKISVVKVVGSNISHKLRLSRGKPAGEGKSPWVKLTNPGDSMVWRQPSKAAPADRLWGWSLEDSGAGVRYSSFQVSSEPVPCSGGEALWQGQQADPEDLSSVLAALRYTCSSKCHGTTTLTPNVTACIV